MRTSVCLTLLAVCLLGAIQSEANLRAFLNRSGGDRTKDIDVTDQRRILSQLTVSLLRQAQDAGDRAVKAYVAKRIARRRKYGASQCLCDVIILYDACNVIKGINNPFKTIVLVHFTPWNRPTLSPLSWYALADHTQPIAIG